MEWFKQSGLALLMLVVGLVVRQPWVMLVWLVVVYGVMACLLVGMVWFGWLGLQALKKQRYQMMNNCLLGVWCCLGVALMLNLLVV